MHEIINKALVFARNHCQNILPARISFSPFVVMEQNQTWTWQTVACADPVTLAVAMTFGQCDRVPDTSPGLPPARKSRDGLVNELTALICLNLTGCIKSASAKQGQLMVLLWVCLGTLQNRCGWLQTWLTCSSPASHHVPRLRTLNLGSVLPLPGAWGGHRYTQNLKCCTATNENLAEKAHSWSWSRFSEMTRQSQCDCKSGWGI